MSTASPLKSPAALKKPAGKRPALKKPMSRQQAAKKLAATRKVAAKKSATVRGGVSSGQVFQGTALSFMSNSAEEIIRHTREGVPARSVAEISNLLEMPRTSFYEAVHISRRTNEARIMKNQTLPPDDSDRIVRVARVLERAIGVFEDSQSARQWLKRQIRSLGGVAPISLLDTQTGYELVMDTLGRIEHGVVA